MIDDIICNKRSFPMSTITRSNVIMEDESKACTRYPLPCHLGSSFQYIDRRKYKEYRHRVRRAETENQKLSRWKSEKERKREREKKEKGISKKRERKRRKNGV